jgi:hypothetical protein
MGDLVGIDGGKKREELVKIELAVIECGLCESAIFSWKVDANNPKQHILSCCVCGHMFPLLEDPASDALQEFESGD